MSGNMFRTRLALFICVLMLLSGLPVGAFDGPQGGSPERISGAIDDHIFTGNRYDHMIRFNDLVFDPAVGILLPPHLRAITDYYIVQFDGPIDQAWKDDLSEMGVRFFWYLPNFGFIARLAPDTKENVMAHDHVRAVYPYYTAFKVPKVLWDIDLGSRPRDFVAVPLEDEAGIAARIVALGGIIHGVSSHEILFTLKGDMLFDIARIPQTGWVQSFTAPTILNDNYGRTIRVRQQNDGAFTNDGDSLWSYNNGNFPGLSAGENIIVAVYDTGMDTTHPAYSNTPGDQPKLVWFKDYNDGSENDWHDTGSHGTHTSCTVLGNGKNRASDPGTDGMYAGMAPRARLIGQAGLSISSGTVYTHLNDVLNHGANHTSNSWGDPGSHKAYTALSSNYDKYTRDANSSKAGDQELLSIFAAGNEGNSGPREPAVSKNVLSVGATGDDKGSSSGTVLGFSAKGPTDDGRMKPDIVTPGGGVFSCSTGSTSYRSASGTSMACPGAAGGIAVLRSYYNNTYGFTPSPALTKALVVNGAKPLPGYSYPGNSQGWGMMNIANSVLENSTKKIFHMEQDANFALATGFSVNIPVQIKSQAPIRATLTWTDVEGASDNPKPSLVNDLNLRVISPSDSGYWGNKFAGGLSVSGGNADSINNIEGFYLPKPASGNWSIRVEAFNVADGPQDFALVISGDISVGSPVLEAEDLIPTNLTMIPKNEILEGDVISINADINNNGSRKTQIVKYQWWIDNDLEDILSFDGDILPKNKVQIEYQWTATRGTHEIRLVVDPYNTHFEQNESNNWISEEIFVDNFGLDLEVEDGSSKKADPGGNATYTLLIKNEGTVNDTFTIEYDDPPSNWSAMIETGSIGVGPGMTGEVNLTVFAPPKALVSESARIQVRVSSDGNDTYNGFVNTITSINQIAALSMTIDVNTSTIQPKGKYTYFITLSNDGNGMDTITLTVNGTPYAWFAGLSDYILVLDPYSSKDISCTVTAPFNAEADFQAAIKVEGFSTSGISTYVNTLTIVDRTWGLNLSTESEPALVEPGGSANFDFTLQNFGNGMDPVSLSVELPDEWGTNITSEEIYLAPFEMLSRNLTITIPDEELAGEYLVHVKAVNESGSELELVLSVTVDQIFDIASTMTPNYVNVTQGDEVTYVLTVTNLGNGDDDYGLWLDSPTLATYASFTDTSLDLGPGGSGVVTLLINTTNLATGNQTVPIHVYSTRSSETSMDLESILEVQAPPSKKVDKPNKPDEPGPIDITPGGTDLRSSGGILFIFLLLVLIIIITAIAIIGYNKYRRLKAEGLEDATQDRIIDDHREWEGARPPDDTVIHEVPEPTFDLDAHMASFTTHKPQDRTSSSETEETIDGEVMEEPGSWPEASVLEKAEDEEGLLPPQIVDDSVSIQLSGGPGIEEPVGATEPDTKGVGDPIVGTELGEEGETGSDAEKDMEDKEKSLDEIMKQLDN